MYTDCPGCQRQFHVYAAQLSAAGGMVKCGFCGRKFNALERLRDKPLPRPLSRAQADIVSDNEPPAEPEFIIPDQEEHIAAGEMAGDTAARADKPAAADAAPARTAETAAAPAADKHKREVRPAAAGPGARSDRQVYPAALLEQPQQKSGWLSRLIWGFGILLMLVFGTSQAAWFNRDRIMSRYPETIAWYGRLCQRFDCQVIRHHDPGAIVLLNRDVRAHPRYKNALLVNATMSNRSQTIQAYPIVQLNLYDTNGNLIAYRRFKPREYLDDSINILRGMAPNVPVHFVLELQDSVKGAVSFEFEFH